jgi:CheY-like chemotaxis protein
MKRLLLMEGNPDHRRIAVEALEWGGFTSWADYEIACVSTGAEALASIAAQAPDMVLLGPSTVAGRLAVAERCLADQIPLTFIPSVSGSPAAQDNGTHIARRVSAFIGPVQRAMTRMRAQKQPQASARNAG